MRDIEKVYRAVKQVRIQEQVLASTDSLAGRVSEATRHLDIADAFKSLEQQLSIWAKG